MVAGRWPLQCAAWFSKSARRRILWQLLQTNCRQVDATLLLQYGAMPRGSGGGSWRGVEDCAQRLHCLGGMRFAAPRMQLSGLVEAPKNPQKPQKSTRTTAKIPKGLLRIPRIPKQGYLNPSEVLLKLERQVRGPAAVLGIGRTVRSCPPQVSTSHNHPHHPLLAAARCSTLLCAALRCCSAVPASNPPAHPPAHQCQSPAEPIQIREKGRSMGL